MSMPNCSAKKSGGLQAFIPGFVAGSEFIERELALHARAAIATHGTLAGLCAVANPQTERLQLVPIDLIERELGTDDAGRDLVRRLRDIEAPMFVPVWIRCDNGFLTTCAELVAQTSEVGQA